MRTILIGVAAGATLVLATLANTANAQTSAPILNAVEVQKLVASADPADNARLSAHFAALAERYAREATRHDAMAQAFIASPIRRTPANTAADHCKRLAALNTQAVNTLRELRRTTRSAPQVQSPRYPKEPLDSRQAPVRRNRRMTSSPRSPDVPARQPITTHWRSTSRRQPNAIAKL